MLIDSVPANVSQDTELAERIEIFEDRADAGRILASLLVREKLSKPLLLALPAGGVPVAVAASEQLGWPLNVAVVSKILLPWNTEAGYGAVAWDGSVQLNRDLLENLGLNHEEIRTGIAATRGKVDARVRQLMSNGMLEDLTGRSVILVDDGLASGFTMLAAAAAIKNACADRIIVAVPTGHVEAVRLVAKVTDQVVCPNLRSRYPFAVAAAYRHWQDVTEEEARYLLHKAGVLPVT